MGRKKKPTALAKLEGNPGKRPLPDESAVLEISGPEPPGWLSKTAREEWDRIVPGLTTIGIVTVLDMAVLVGYCNAFARMVLAEKGLTEMLEEGDPRALVLRYKSGAIQKHPLISIAEKATAETIRYASEFGGTPAARRIIMDGMPSAGNKSKFAGLIGGKKK